MVSNFNYRLTASICSALVILAFSMTVHRSITLNMGAHPGIWAVNSIPAVLSKMAFGHKPKYTTNQTIKTVFHSKLETYANNPNRINLAINDTLLLNQSDIGTTIEYLGDDDKGVVDMIETSFQIFGYKVEAILYFYLLLLFISSVAFIVANFSNPGRLTLLLTFWIMLYLMLPMIVLHKQLISVIALRALPVLSMIACLHCIFYALQPKTKVRDLILLSLQCALIIYVVHLRTTTQWQIYIIALLSILIFITNKTRNLRTVAKHGLPIIFLIAGLVLLQYYKAVAFASYQHSNQPVTRVFWHNIFSGLAFSPEIASKYNLKIDDQSVFAATREFMTETGRSKEWLKITENENQNPVHWDDYDQAAKEMLFARCKKDPFECFKATFYYKPKSLINQIAWLYGLRYLPPDMDIFISKYFGDVVKLQIIETTHLMDAADLRASPWSQVCMLLLLPFIFLIFMPVDLTLLYATLVLTLGSMIPVIVGYPAPFTIVESAIAIGMLLYCSLWSLIGFLVNQYQSAKISYSTINETRI